MTALTPVGRGSWAGPVTVAAVVPPDQHLPGIRDSKMLTPAERTVAARRVTLKPLRTGGPQEMLEVADVLKRLAPA